MNAAWRDTLSRRECAIIGGLWAALALAYIAINWSAIGAMRMPDADDYLRLQQVRDWLAGQAWFDVSQHRINPPTGGALHWSRLVDLPIAFFIVALRPFLGQAQAEMAASVIVPMLTLGIIMALVGAIAARLVGRTWAPLAALAVEISGLIYPPILPLRVDHHGWQIVAALTMFWALLDETRPRRSGVIAGIAAALWLNISLEALPMTVCAGAIVAVRWLLDAKDLPRLQAFIWTLLAAVFVFETGTIRDAWSGVECDRFSTPYMLALALVAAGLGFAQLKIFNGDWRVRLALGGTIALAAGGLFLIRAPMCLAGPFGNLEPLTRAIWLDNVAESKPLWASGLGFLIADGGFALVGCIGAVWALRIAADAQQRVRWATALVLSLAATALMMMLVRMGGVAHAFVAPGAVFVGCELFTRARAQQATLVRVLGTVFAILIATPVLPFMAIKIDAPPPNVGGSCNRDIPALSALPTGVIFAPLDMSPQIVAQTAHSVVATGHHRNHAAMNDVIRAFTSDADTAHA